MLVVVVAVEGARSSLGGGAGEGHWVGSWAGGTEEEGVVAMPVLHYYRRPNGTDRPSYLAGRRRWLEQAGHGSCQGEGEEAVVRWS